MTRCFVAVELPDAVRAALAHAQQQLRDTGTYAGREVEPTDMHVTLAFLGELDDEEIAQTRAALGGVRMPPFTARLDGLGSYGRPVRVIWAGIVDDSMHALYDAVHGALGPRAFDERGYSAHITLARVRRVKDGPLLRAALAYVPEPLTFRVESFALIRSTLTRDGPVYDLIERFRLTGVAGA